MKARDAATGNRGATKGSGHLGQDAGGRSVSGFTGGDAKPGELPARTGYAGGSHNRTGTSDKSTKIPLPRG